jgi:ribulose-phosphate 3-epimerase
MDGHFVPNLTVGPVVVKSLKKHTSLPLDVHLMISDPLQYGAPFAKAGAWGLTFHVEAVKDPSAVISEYKKLGVKPGLSLKPKTPASAVLPYLKDLNVVLVMTVEPGFGGQSFMADMLPKVKEISSYIKEHKLACKVEVDGGIDPVTAPETVKAGAEVLVAGQAIFGKSDPVMATAELRRAAEEVLLR